MTIKNVDLPQLGSSVESVLQAGEYRIYSAKFQPFSFSITFRDFGGLDFRNYFSAIWMDSQRGYFNDVRSEVIISINSKLAFKSEDCLITAVSQVQLDNESSQIAEFTVEFTSPYYTNAQILKFGKDKWQKGGTDFKEGLNAIESIVGDNANGVLSDGITAVRDAINIAGIVQTW